MGDANKENQFLNDACTENLVSGFIKALYEFKENFTLNEESEEPSAGKKGRKELTSRNEERKESTTGKEEKESNEFKAEKQIKQKAIAQNEIEKLIAENEIVKNANGANRKCINNSWRILKEKLNNEKFVHKLCYFVDKVARIIQRCYEISKHGSSDINYKNIDLYWTVRCFLRDYVANYRSEEHRDKYLHIANDENRHKILYATVYNEIVHSCCHKKQHEIIQLCCLSIFAAFDLQETAGFENAVYCVTNSVTEALLMTNSYWIDVWDENPKVNLSSSSSE